MAAERDVPILLSIGYAACHWCHVMAHESFSDAEVAAAANAGFVCIKVDREERPDLDAVYMNATVALTGQGGWPMTCFLTPDGRPFFCGTYYPKTSFLQLLAAVTETWRTRRAEVEQTSDHIAGELRSMAVGLPGVAPRSPRSCATRPSPRCCARRMPSAAGSAPLRNSRRRHCWRRCCATTNARARRRRWRRWSGRAPRWPAAVIYDQLAGGFARYSVDASWVVPHFEKMLYDNAQLLRVYAHWARRSGNALARRVTAETADFLLDELRRDGMFVSSLDADAAGREGLTYVWTPDELRDVLGPDDGRWAAEVFGVTDGRHLRGRRSRCCSCRSDPDDAERFEAVRTVLRAARSTRPQPGRDDKVVTAWNGLAITGLAEASVALGSDELLAAATECARSILDLHMVDGRLRRASLGGAVGGSAAILDDHAALATGLLTLHQVTGDIGVAGRRDRTAGRRARALRRPGPAGPLVRRGRRRRAAGAAARGPARRSHAVGGVVDGGGPAAGRSPGAGPARASATPTPPTRPWTTARRAAVAGAALGRATGLRLPRPRCGARSRSRSPAPIRPGRNCSPPRARWRRAGRSSSGAVPTRRSCWPAGRGRRCRRRLRVPRPRV